MKISKLLNKWYITIPLILILLPLILWLINPDGSVEKMADTTAYAILAFLLYKFSSNHFKKNKNI